MYHWFLIIKKTLRSDQPSLSFDDKLIAGHETDIFNSVRRRTTAKLFVVGLIEFIPIISGFFAFHYLGKIIFPFDFILVGLLISILLIKYFIKETPDLPFSLHA